MKLIPFEVFKWKHNIAITVERRFYAFIPVWTKNFQLKLKLKP